MGSVLTKEETGKVGDANSRLHPVPGALLRKFPHLRSSAYLLFELRDLLFYRPGRARAVNSLDYDSRVDPWGYATPWGTEHLRVVADLLNRAAGAKRFRRVMDVGCGEGQVSEFLANRCDFLLGVEIAPRALGRARQRCHSWTHLHFSEWDLRKDAAPGTFDLILLLGVVECFGRPSEFCIARAKIIEMLEPGGILLILTTQQNEALETAWWGHWLPRGGKPIERYFSGSSELELAESFQSKTHFYSVFRRKAAG